MTTNEFFRFTLPSQCVYFLAEPKEIGYKHMPFHNVDDMAEKALQLSSQGKNIFHACASYERESYVGDDGKTHWRTAENAVFTRSQWLDIDCGKEQYADQKKAIKDLIRFVKETGIPRPNLIVNSGNGIHVYWVFDRDIPKAEWRPVAKIFKSVCARFNFSQDDTTRTSDITSVLRPIGTVNDKSHKGMGVKPVKLIGEPHEKPVVFDLWKAKIEALGVATGTTTKVINAELYSGMSNRKPWDAELCKSMLAVLDPDCPEPEWFEVLGSIAGWSGGSGEGMEIAKAWSRGDYNA